MTILDTGFWNTLLSWDQSLFKFINQYLSNPVFDVVMPFFRNPVHWAPLYLFLFVFALLNFRGRGFWWILFFIITVSLSDYTGTNVFKYNFERIRPCNNPELSEQLRLLVRCPSGFGFISNHAANHFGMATFIFLTFRHLFRRAALLAFLWAGIIVFAQVYVGVHYPSDILCGALVGILFGTITGLQFNKWFALPAPGSRTG